MRVLSWIPVVAVTVVHLIALIMDADGVAAWSQVLLMPALAVVLLSVVLLAQPRASREATHVRSARTAAWPWALGALAGSWVGDSLPKVVPEEAQFLAMIGGFAVAQVLWIVAFTRVRGSRPPVPFILLLAVVAIALLAVTAPRAGVLAPAVVVYGLLLAATAYVAASHGWVGALGGAFFVLSDGLIALGAFRPELVDWAQRDLVVMATYVLAQALFVATIIRPRTGARGRGESPAGPRGRRLTR